MTTTRLMRDSTTITDIPVTGTEIVMAYVNGRYAARPAAVAHRFGPHVPVVWVDVLGDDPHADVLDVETGDATVATAVAWTRQKLELHGSYLPVIYSSRDSLTPLFNAMDAAGLKIAQQFRTGISTLDGTRAVADMTGVTFVQDRGTDLTGGHFDESIVYDPHWKAMTPAC